MTPLSISEYDASYFDGALSRYRHNAGYTRYQAADVWRERAERWVAAFDLKGKRVLDVGCAKGFLVEHMNDLGVNAYGVDASHWCIEECGLEGTSEAAQRRRPDLAGRFICSEAHEYLSSQPDGRYDLLISTGFLMCLPPDQMPDLVAQFNRVSSSQIHLTQRFPTTQYYVSKTPAEWLEAYNWSDGVIITESDEVRHGS